MSSSRCHDYFLPRPKDQFHCQVVLPIHFTLAEAERICAFIKTLAVDFKPEPDAANGSGGSDGTV